MKQRMDLQVQEAPVAGAESQNAFLSVMSGKLKTEARGEQPGLGKHHPS